MTSISKQATKAKPPLRERGQPLQICISSTRVIVYRLSFWMQTLPAIIVAGVCRKPFPDLGFHHLKI
ncbi:unnamed protein product [Cuscuta campestris]|uniref:Uncharacterized protein n=1 Tax=Cuscuta campestris TaxID=132261 RepID=A0A484LTB0_9ASTE|nr:unnamed protein product [Cuscuta campestris]